MTLGHSSSAARLKHPVHVVDRLASSERSFLMEYYHGAIVL